MEGTRNEQELIGGRMIDSLAEHATPKEKLSAPSRCRAIVFNDDESCILGIRRARAGQKYYTTYPGGGIEPNEIPEMAIQRELLEELNISPEDIRLKKWVIELGDQYFYVGQLTSGIENFRMGGPEIERPISESGTYEPSWIPLNKLESSNFLPEEITQLVIKSRGI